MDLEIYDEHELVSASHLKLAQDLIRLGAQEINLAADTEMSLTFCTATGIQQLNRRYRATDKPTDVISFALEDGDDAGIKTRALEEEFGLPRNLGDLFICPEVVQAHAQEYGHSVEREFGYTVVHGLLHLSGFDHIESQAAQEMFALQEKILQEAQLQR
ncbi:rRNA maturation RNase YbeY [Lactobacillus sp. DCY120]|uniref:Endoribonuclease YbeY n=1 Tax=Bombilactobacillus apium TaxID=2675299 RepID=A0A850R5G3_9LACO|nr:rRNA maturation RNase YbeY [Bombilactobacillus apium]NVY95842.1 rRNA maturation RNase YbeY [Bombilactobacillus apium]